jgi:hypothetical protein
LYTAFLVFINFAVTLPTNYVLPSEIPFLDESSIVLRVRGSKFNVLSEVFQNAIQWTVKCCMLLLYCRLLSVKLVVLTGDLHTDNLEVLILVTAYVIFTYIIQQGLYFGYWCHPFERMWVVPARNSKSPEFSPESLPLGIR